MNESHLEADAAEAMLLQQMVGHEAATTGAADRLSHLIDSAVQLLGVDSVGLMLLDEHDLLCAVGFSDRPASLLETVQARLQRGPGIDTTRRAEVILVEDLGAEPQYADLWAEMAGTPVRAVLSCPVWTDGVAVGNLNLARHAPHVWSAAEARSATAYARIVGLSVNLAAHTNVHADRIALLGSNLTGGDTTKDDLGPAAGTPIRS